TGKHDSGVISGLLRWRFGAGRLAAASIGSIADQGMAEMGEMHPNLMRASGFEPALDKGRKGLFFPFSAGGESLQHAVACARGLSLAAQHGHAFAVERIAPEIAFDESFPGARRAPHDRIVGAL